MKNRKVVMLACVVVFALMAVCAFGADTQSQTTCPVMGGEINRHLYVDVKGKRIYVCCSGCLNAVKMAPDKYLTQMEKDGIELEAVPAEE